MVTRSSTELKFIVIDSFRRESVVTTIVPRHPELQAGADQNRYNPESGRRTIRKASQAQAFYNVTLRHASDEARRFRHRLFLSKQPRFLRPFPL